VRLTSTAAVLGLATLRAVAAAAEGPRVDPLLQRAIAYAAGYGEKLSLVRATERYEQKLVLEGRPGYFGETRSRLLISDVLWVPTRNDMALLFYRDVYSVNGEPTRDRGDRLSRLFPGGPSDVGRARAEQILNESARFNLGSSYRNVNFPTLALTFLHPQNSQRFRFRLKGTTTIAGRQAREIEFREHARPTLARTTKGQDQAASGAFWVALEDGAIVQSDLRFDDLPGRIRVSYRFEPRLGVFVPEEMHEFHGGGRFRETIQGVARYGEYARGDADVGPILYKK
jgi:hypothetical protein